LNIFELAEITLETMDSLGEHIDKNKLGKFYIIFGSFLSIFLFITIYSISNTDQKISLYNIPLILGVLYETKKLCKRWDTLIIKTLLSILLSLILTLMFIGLTRDDMSNKIISFWPITFVVTTILLTFNLYSDKISTKLTEGVTLMQSIAVIYWIAMSEFLIHFNWFKIFLILLILYFIIFSFYNAISYTELTRRKILTLSIWSSIIMFFFSLNYIYKMYVFFDSDTSHLNSFLYYFFQYFI